MERTTDNLIELKVTQMRNETADTRSFIVEPVSGEPLRYVAGQFITLVFPNSISNGRRAYSISSAPVLHEPLTFTVKRVANGEFSRFLVDYATVGTSLFTIGASGLFVLPPDPERFGPFVFYAAGSGITPVWSLIKTLLVGHPATTVRLVYSNRTRNEAIFVSEIEAMEERFPDRFKVEWFFSDARDLLRARLSKSRVGEQLRDAAFASRLNSLFYLCGPHGFMQMISIALLSEGVPAAHIRKEIFDVVKPPLRELPPDTETHGVRIEYAGETYHLTTAYPTTILEAAKRRGILLPYSCEAGKCGTCAATCVTGRIWMSSNEVLLDQELQAGRVLTCTGFPVGGDVELSFRG